MKFQNMSEYFNRINMLFHGIVGVPLVIFVFLYLELDSGGLEALFAEGVVNLIILVLFAILSGLMVWYAFNTYAKYKVKGQKGVGIVAKLKALQAGMLYYYTLLGAVSLLLLLGLFITASKLFVVCYVLIVMILSMHRPSLEKISADLKLKGEEKNIVLNKRAL